MPELPKYTETQHKAALAAVEQAPSGTYIDMVTAKPMDGLTEGVVAIARYQGRWYAIIREQRGRRRALRGIGHSPKLALMNLERELAEPPPTSIKPPDFTWVPESEIELNTRYLIRLKNGKLVVGFYWQSHSDQPRRLDIEYGAGYVTATEAEDEVAIGHWRYA